MLKQYVGGKFVDVGSIYSKDGNELRPISVIYQYKGGEYIPIWEGGAMSNFITADGKIFITADNKIFNVII